MYLRWLLALIWGVFNTVTNAELALLFVLEGKHKPSWWWLMTALTQGFLESPGGMEAGQINCRLFGPHHPSSVWTVGIAEGFEREKDERGIQGQGKQKLSWGRKERKGRREEKIWRGRPCVNFKKVCDGCCCSRQPWPLYRCFCSPAHSLLHPPFHNRPPPPPPLLLLSFFPWCLWWSSARGAGGYQSHRCLLQTSKPRGPPSFHQPQSSYPRCPGGKPPYTGKKYLICLLREDQQ